MCFFLNLLMHFFSIWKSIEKKPLVKIFFMVNYIYKIVLVSVHKFTSAKGTSTDPLISKTTLSIFLNFCMLLNHMLAGDLIYVSYRYRSVRKTIIIIFIFIYLLLYILSKVLYFYECHNSKTTYKVHSVTK